MANIKNIEYMKKAILKDISEYKKNLLKSKNFSDENINILKYLRVFFKDENNILKMLLKPQNSYYPKCKNNSIDKMTGDININLICKRYGLNSFKFLNDRKNIVFVCTYDFKYIINFFRKEEIDFDKINFFSLEFLGNSKSINLKKNFFDNLLLQKVDPLFISNMNIKIKEFEEHTRAFGIKADYGLLSNIQKNGKLKLLIEAYSDAFYICPIKMNKHSGLLSTYTIIKKSLKETYRVNSYNEFKKHYEKQIQINNYINDFQNLDFFKKSLFRFSTRYLGNVIEISVHEPGSSFFCINFPLDSDIKNIGKIKLKTKDTELDYALEDWIDKPEEIYEYVKLINY